jgi:hypothetical protein
MKQRRDQLYIKSNIDTSIWIGEQIHGLGTKIYSGTSILYWIRPAPKKYLYIQLYLNLESCRVDHTKWKTWKCRMKLEIAFGSNSLRANEFKTQRHCAFTHVNIAVLCSTAHCNGTGICIFFRNGAAQPLYQNDVYGLLLFQLETSFNYS